MLLLAFKTTLLEMNSKYTLKNDPDRFSFSLPYTKNRQRTVIELKEDNLKIQKKS